MPTTFAFAGQKGGSGKTTTALAMAAELQSRGSRVLLVDADPQGSVRTWGAVAAEMGHTTPTIVSMDATMHRPEHLPELSKGYDFVVIDCPPRHGEVMKSAVIASDVAVLPCGPSSMDAWALGESLELIESARVIRPNLKACVAITRKIARTTIGESARDVLAEGGLPVLKTELHYRVAYQEAPAAGLGVAQYAAGTSAAGEVESLVDELLVFAGVNDGQEAKPGATQAA